MFVGPVGNLNSSRQVDPAVFVGIAESYFAENQQCIMAHQASMEHVLDLQATLKSKSLEMALWARVLHWALTGGSTLHRSAGDVQ